ncbi:hypothetical protein [uncultured Corynebacterium sp.]|uniref:hypothetical protein n=1 Tax=uncultured Corynebacterium sp. TaxID=159447 RepID=UPI00259B4164|nr:hypothetical protein [uncultured Corynebacterium sp.]
MAYSTRTKRISIAAGALSIALVAPFVSVSTSDLPAAHAQTVATQASDFDTPEEVNFWDAKTVELKDLALNPGDKIDSTYWDKTTRWPVTVDAEGNLTIGKPWNKLTFSNAVKAGSAEIPIKVTPASGEPYEATLKITVKDEKPAEETTTPETTTAESEAPAESSEPEAPSESSEPEAPAESEGPSTSEEAPAPEAPKFDFDKTYEAENFWNKETVPVPDAKLEPGDKIASTYWDSTTRWPVTVDAEGNLTIGKPWNKITFNNAIKAGSADIPVTITPKEGEPYSGTLKVKLTDTMPPAEWEGDLPDFSKIYSVDFEKQRVKPVPGLTLPENVTIERSGAKYPLWSFTNLNGEVQVNAPATFTPGVFDLPVKISDGTSTVERTIRINATNPQTTGGEIAKGIGGVLGPILGGLIGGGTGGIGGAIGNLLGGLIGGGSGGSGEDGKGGSGGGLLGSLKGALEGIVKVEDGAIRIENNGNNNGHVTVTGNANPTVNISDNGSNNGNPQVSVVVTDNAKVHDNGNVTITGNANPTVNISDNGNNNGNPNVVVTNNANPTVNITDNANNNASNNGNPDIKISDNAKASVVVTNNANPTVNVSDNASNNGNPNVVVTNNANPTVNVSDNANNNGNPDVKISDNAKATVVVTNNANPTVNVSDNGNNNGNPDIKVSDNANPNVQGIPLSSGGGSSKGGGQGGEGQGQGNGGSSNLNARVGAEGGISDPRCIATLVGLGLPLLAAIPVALSNQLGIQAAGVDKNSIDRALRDTARSLNVDANTLTAVGGGLVGVVVTLLAIAGLRSCIPNVKDIDITVGSSGNQGQQPTGSVTTTAPVVPTTPAK